MTDSHDHTHSDSHDHTHDGAQRWKHDGVRVIPGDQLDPNVPSTAGMDRKAAINFARVGAQKLWAGTVTIKPDAKTGAHHHGHLESIIYVVKGKARMRWGEHLQFTAEANPGDFIFIPPYVPHQEINASPDEALECVLVRSDGQAVAINLDIEPVEKIRQTPNGHRSVRHCIAVARPPFVRALAANRSADRAHYLIVTSVTPLTRLLASKKLPSGVTEVLRTMFPPPGIAQL